MNKCVYLLHGWGGVPEAAFRPYLKKELVSRGYIVKDLAFPDTNNPQLETWLAFLQKNVTTPLERTILVGHSLGATTVLRFLENLPEGEVLSKAVFVAGVYDHIMNLTKEEKLIADRWFEKPLNTEKINRSVREIIAFFSDNDMYIPLSTEGKMREQLGARTIIEHDMGHYSDDSGRLEVPAVLAEILK